MSYRYRPHRDGIKKTLYVLMIVVALVVLPFLAWGKLESHKQRIRNWAAENNYTVVEIETKIFTKGPFWYKDKDHEIYRAVLRDHYEKKKVAWFRIGFWRFDQEWE